MNDYNLHQYLENEVHLSCENLERRDRIFETIQNAIIIWSKQSTGGETSLILKPFGSVLLGSELKTSDLDLIVVAPSIFSREYFFSTFTPFLTSQFSSGSLSISNLHVISNAFTPVIKFFVNGEVSVDLIFARMSISSIPSEIDLLDDSLLENMSDVDLRCLNGLRVSEYLITHLGDCCELGEFQDALRVVKMWAVGRGVYSPILGFFSGVLFSFFN